MRYVSAILLTWLMPLTSIHAASPAESCHLRVGWEPYAPYTFADDEGRVTGADIELVEAIGGEIGCEIEFAELPWARILREVELGTLDISTSTSLTPERTVWALFSKPYRQTEMAIYVRRGEAPAYPLTKLADVGETGFRLGIIVDYFYGPEFDELSRTREFGTLIDGATDYRTNIVKLINGRIDGYLAEDVRVMDTELDQLGYRGQVERHPLRISGENLRLMFSRKTVDPELVDAVDTAIERMRTEGRLEAISRKYAP